MAESRGDRRKSAVLGKEIEKRLCWITKTKAVNKSIGLGGLVKSLGVVPQGRRNATQNENGLAAGIVH